MVNYTVTIDGAPTDLELVSSTAFTSKYDTWNIQAALSKSYEGLVTGLIKRNGTEVMQGPVISPDRHFSGAGSKTPVSGFGYGFNLTRYITGTGTIVDKTLQQALQEMLDESPSSHGITLGDVDEFYLNRVVFEYDTSLEYLLSWAWEDATLRTELDTIEIQDETRVGTATSMGAFPGVRANFFYDGTTKRYYHWYVEGGDLYYEHTTDFSTWTRVDSGYNPTGDRWSVAWYNSKVYLFFYDGANTDMARGTITDGTGAISFSLVGSNIFAGQLYQGPFFDDDGHIWVIRDNASGQVYESTNDGTSFTYRFGPGGNELHAIAPTLDGTGDVMALVLDTVNSDAEIWKWDASLTSFAFQEKLEDENDMDKVDSAIGPNGWMAFVWEDSGDLFLATSTDYGANWAETEIITLVATNNLHLSCYGDAYWTLHVSSAVGNRLYQYNSSRILVDTSATFPDIATTADATIPRGYAHGNLKLALSGIDSGDDIQAFVMGYQDIRPVNGTTTGTMTSDGKTGDGSWERWGVLTHLGQNDAAGIRYDILDTSDVVLASDLSLDADLFEAGVTDATIKIKLKFDNTGGLDPYLEEIDLWERSQLIESFPYDLETFDSLIKRLRKIAGGEYDLNSDDTLDYKLTLGTDRSATITLQEGVNCKSIVWEQDYRGYANVLTVIGSGTKGVDRVEVTLRDAAEIDQEGEWWATPIRDTELTTDAMAYNRGTVELPNLVTRKDRIRVTFYDNLAGTILRRGDTVMVVSPKTGLSQSARIKALTRTWRQGRGEEVKADLGFLRRNEQAFSFINEIEDIKRVI